MRRCITLALFVLAAACSRAPVDPAVHATNAPLRHVEIRADQLPAPYATRSAVNLPRVTGPPASAALHLPPGFSIAVYAANLDNPRGMLLAPNGDVIVSEPAAGRVIILRDTRHRGAADQRFTFVSGLDAPYGLALHGGFLYVGDEDAVIRFPYTPGQTRASGGPQHITSLPSGGHSTRGLLFSRDGAQLFVSVGSRSNVSTGEPPERAAILEMNPDGSGRRIFASGIRNPVGMAWEPVTGALWTAVNERDGLGNDLPPDYTTAVRAGGFYGWPYAYTGPHPDPRHRGERPDLVARTIVPDVLIQAHSAPLGIVFYEGSMFPSSYRGDAFVALHGSWNRSPRTGYEVIAIPFRNGRPSGGYDEFVTGWLPDPASRSVWGRPVGLLVLGDGSLLISDDGGDKIWRVTYGKSR